MSGVCGIVNFDGAPAERETLEAMAEAAAHRGPDGIRFCLDGPVGISHLALDTTPESIHERQPLVDGGLVLAADARIDNRDELIHVLRMPNSSTDADLILAAYRRWGEECAARLVGDFAFVVWDGRRNRLLAARDPMAVRSLYYRVEACRILFGTEAKQILAAPGVPRRIFEPAVGAYLAGCFEPLEWSHYEGISQLAPAHTLIRDENGIRVRRHWDINPENRIEYASEEEYVEHFFEVFAESVRCRMRSAKPVGILLSGGMDSASAASVAGRLTRSSTGSPPPGFRAYSWAYDEFPECDERHISGMVAEHYGIPVTEVPVAGAWPLADFPAHGPDEDEPFIGVYQAILERSFETARSEGMGSVMSGSRGDLMVGGEVFDYPGLLSSGNFRALRDDVLAHARWHGVSPVGILKSFLVKPMVLDFSQRGAGLALAMRRKLLGSERRPEYPGWVSPEFAARINLDDIVRRNEEPRNPMGEELLRQRHELIFTGMQMRGVAWTERTQARFGMSFCDPWSDRRLAETILAMPQWRVHQLNDYKRIAGLAMRGVMPEKARRIADKIVPTPLYHRALRESGRGGIQTLISGSEAAARGYVNEKALQNHYESILAGGRDHPLFWMAVSLEWWLRRSDLVSNDSNMLL